MVLDVQIAQLPVRAVSAIIDMTVMFIGYIMGLTLWAASLSELDEALTIAFLIIFTVLVLVGYPVIMETATRAVRWARLPWAYAWCPMTAAQNASARHCFARWRRWWRSGCCWAARP
ncbi:putative integral membrane protein [Mycobacterium ulcerans str. Harvey]|uniref:Integral membrane protein n=1 Tax=Mycobacterium ulcerans str. Harvey TaxID=1299332 RepID=A0ABN0QPR5_MYCUL|nr:putative integral membrane protein [Mycobacterium ulcerans str. Harvey]